MANFQVYPTNLANPGRIGTIRMTLNIIFVLIIITHAQGFESIKIFGGEGDLAAPYSAISHFAVKLKIKVVTDIYLNMELKMQQKKAEVVFK